MLTVWVGQWGVDGNIEKRRKVGDRGFPLARFHGPHFDQSVWVWVLLLLVLTLGRACWWELIQARKGTFCKMKLNSAKHLSLSTIIMQRPGLTWDIRESN